jgi:rubrerythrin
MLNITDIDKITKVLESMMQYELALSDLYAQCADIWKEDKAFWESLAHAEMRHAENIQKMKEIIKNKQNNFEVGRPFNLVALHTALAGLNDNIKKVKEGALSCEKLLVLARDIEQSVLESHYAEIVKTTDLEYQTLMKNILVVSRVFRFYFGSALSSLLR